MNTLIEFLRLCWPLLAILGLLFSLLVVIVLMVLANSNEPLDGWPGDDPHWSSSDGTESKVQESKVQSHGRKGSLSSSLSSSFHVRQSARRGIESGQVGK